jgi:molybdopterin molybdotransferase
VKDDWESLLMALESAKADSDIIVISGGSSKGKKDMSSELIEKAADCGVLTHGIAAKPGKPTITGFDKESRTMFIGLPGHPAAALMVFEQILIRIWRDLTCQPKERTVRAKITVNVQSAPGRRTFQLVTLQETDDTLAIPLFAKSGMISPMTRADGYFEMSENQEGVRAGDLVHVHLWK